MKRKSNISLGPGAASLILILVVLSLSVLGMLALMNARSDLVLSQRNAQVIESTYALNVRAEKTRACLDEALYELSLNAKSPEAYYDSVALILALSTQTSELEEYDALLTAFESAAQGDESVMDSLLSLAKKSGNYDALRQTLTVLSELHMDGDTVSWTQTDGIRTLECELKLLPPGEEARSQWLKYAFTASTVEEW